MNKILKIILISSIAIFSAGFLFILPTNAQSASLIVEYSTDGGANWLSLSGPIFSEINFMPGNDVSRLVRVTNNNGELQRIATEAIEVINESDPNNFATQLNLTIKENATDIFNDTLQKFFDQGETYLSSLASGAQTQYNFIITFNSGAGNYYQEKALGFDILVGFEGTEGGLPLPPPGGGTGGGLPPGLTIQNETATTVTETSVTITWLTSYAATSQVIYALGSENHILDLTDAAGTPPKYGYAHTTLESDVSPKVINHSVTIYGLNSATTYYYRAVSHGSFAISTEHSFTTLMPGGEVAGEATKRKFFEEVGEEGTTTTTTAPLSKFVAGISTIGPFSCPVNLTMSGINPLLASLLCLGQNACDTCLNPLIILLLGIGILIIAFSLAAAKLLNNWIAFIITLAVILYLLLFVLGVCLSPWLIFIIGLVAIIVALLISRLKRE